MRYIKQVCKKQIFPPLLLAAITLSLTSTSRTQPVNYHMYVYNECRSMIDVSASFFPFNQGKMQSSKTSVRPGTQEMVAVSDRAAFGIEAATDGMAWDKMEFNTSVAEYTHVLSCACTGTDCPSPWPGGASTRQYGR